MNKVFRRNKHLTEINRQLTFHTRIYKIIVKMLNVIIGNRYNGEEIIIDLSVFEIQ